MVGPASAVVEPSNLSLRDGKADAQTFGLAEPACAFGLGDPVVQIAADLPDGAAEQGRWEKWAADAAAFMLATYAVGATAVAPTAGATFLRSKWPRNSSHSVSVGWVRNSSLGHSVRRRAMKVRDALPVFRRGRVRRVHGTVRGLPARRAGTAGPSRHRHRLRHRHRQPGDGGDPRGLPEWALKVRSGGRSPAVGAQCSCADRRPVPGAPGTDDVGLPAAFGSRVEGRHETASTVMRSAHSLSLPQRPRARCQWTMLLSVT